VTANRLTAFERVTPEQYDRIREVLVATSAMGAARRAAYLSETCGGNASLRAEVESFLANDAQVT
jgi:hypothetical protein